MVALARNSTTYLNCSRWHLTLFAWCFARLTGPLKLLPHLGQLWPFLPCPVYNNLLVFDEIDYIRFYAHPLVVVQSSLRGIIFGTVRFWTFGR